MIKDLFNKYRNKKLLLFRQKVIEAQKELHKAIKSSRKRCEHKVGIEAGYYIIISTFPPRRMCLNCGLEEEGWGSGYNLLKNMKILYKFTGREDRDEFYKFRY